MLVLATLGAGAPVVWPWARLRWPFLADYYFVTREVMQQDIAAGDFIEHAEFSGNLYGTRWATLGTSTPAQELCLQLDLGREPLGVV